MSNLNKPTKFPRKHFENAKVINSLFLFQRHLSIYLFFYSSILSFSSSHHHSLPFPFFILRTLKQMNLCPFHFPSPWFWGGGGRWRGGLVKAGRSSQNLSTHHHNVFFFATARRQVRVGTVQVGRLYLASTPESPSPFLPSSPSGEGKIKIKILCMSHITYIYLGR